jgi:hypothetical protein
MTSKKFTFIVAAIATVGIALLTIGVVGLVRLLEVL